MSRIAAVRFIRAKPLAIVVLESNHSIFTFLMHSIFHQRKRRKHTLLGLNLIK